MDWREYIGSNAEICGGELSGNIPLVHTQASSCFDPVVRGAGWYWHSFAIGSRMFSRRAA
jgi:hypothetical protein